MAILSTPPRFVMAAGVPVKSCVIVQYVALRRDLLTTHKWPLGAVIAQACHACTAVMHTCRDDPQCQQYLTDLDRMHKVVVEVMNSRYTACHDVAIQLVMVLSKYGE